jgi:monofunctional glycosyltransferase
MIRKVFRVLVRLIVWGMMLSILTVIVFRFVPIPCTPLMGIRSVEQWVAGKKITCSYTWVSLEQVSKHVPLALVAAEDQNYLDHHGFDLDAIYDAVQYNTHHRIKRGASTISQQTAKNVFLWQSRSYIRKGLEVYFTTLIELLWSKERIIEVYLNVIEMGDGIYGAEAAAQYYYHSHAQSLTIAQAASIAAILPNPLKWSPLHPPAPIAARQKWIIQQMSNLGGKLEY